MVNVILYKYEFLTLQQKAMNILSVLNKECIKSVRGEGKELNLH